METQTQTAETTLNSMEKLPQILKQYVELVGPNFSRIPKEVLEDALKYNTIRDTNDWHFDTIKRETNTWSLWSSSLL